MDKSFENVFEDALRDLDDDDDIPVPSPPSSHLGGERRAGSGNEGARGRGRGMAFDPLRGTGPRGRGGRAPQSSPQSAGPSAPEMPGDVDALCASLTGLLTELGNCDPPGNVPPQNPGRPEFTDFQATLDALDAAAKAGFPTSNPGRAQGGVPGMPSDGSNTEQALVEVVMRKLLSKDMLHEPLKDISQQYPKWLEEKGKELKSEDVDKYRRQHSYIQRICEVYDNQPDDYEQLINLFQEVQACGEPPKEIIDAVAPEFKALEGGVPGAMDQECLHQ